VGGGERERERKRRRRRRKDVSVACLCARVCVRGVCGGRGRGKTAIKYITGEK